MENNSHQQLTAEKPYKSKLWIVGKIYFYIIGANLLFVVVYSIFPGIGNHKVLGSLVLIALIVIVPIFAIRRGTKSVLQKSIVYPQEIWKISLLVVMPPLAILFFAIISILNVFLDDLYPREASGIVFFVSLTVALWASISSLVYGIATYFWFKRLPSTTISQ